MIFSDPRWIIERPHIIRTIEFGEKIAKTLTRRMQKIPYAKNSYDKSHDLTIAKTRKTLKNSAKRHILLRAQLKEH
jgi:hypothetical protein